MSGIRLIRMKHLQELIAEAQAQLPVVKLEQPDLAHVVTITQVSATSFSTTITSHEGGIREPLPATSLEEALARLMDTYAPGPRQSALDPEPRDPWLGVHLVPADA